MRGVGGERDGGAGDEGGCFGECVHAGEIVAVERCGAAGGEEDEVEGEGGEGVRVACLDYCCMVVVFSIGLLEMGEKRGRVTYL